MLVLLQLTAEGMLSIKNSWMHPRSRSNEVADLGSIEDLSSIPPNASLDVSDPTATTMTKHRVGHQDNQDRIKGFNHDKPSGTTQIGGSQMWKSG